MIKLTLNFNSHFDNNLNYFGTLCFFASGGEYDQSEGKALNFNQSLIKLFKRVEFILLISIHLDRNYAIASREKTKSVIRKLFRDEKLTNGIVLYT